jgi:hypothetical protein
MCVATGVVGANMAQAIGVRPTGRQPFAHDTLAFDSTHFPLDGTPVHGVLVVSPGDCNGNLGLSGIMLRGTPPAMARNVVVAVVGTANDTAYVRLHLPAVMAANPLRLLTDSERAMLLSIGHRETPVLLLYDDANRLRMATHTEADPVARLAFSRAVSHFIHRTPSP